MYDMNLVKSYVPIPQKLYHLTRRLGTLDRGIRDLLCRI